MSDVIVMQSPKGGKVIANVPKLTLIHCPVFGCRHRVSAVREGQADLSIVAHIAKVHRPDLFLVNAHNGAAV
jgi:hypothetical protein